MEITTKPSLYMEPVDSDALEIKGVSTVLAYPVAVEYRVAPVMVSRQNLLVLATPVEQSVDDFRKLRFLLGREFLFYRMTADEYEKLVNSTWTAEERKSAAVDGDPGFKANLTGVTGQSPVLNATRMTAAVQDSVSAVQLVDDIFSRAIAMGASDIHFEPQDSDLKVRFRLDGILHPAFSIEKGRQNEILSRLKILAHMDIAEKRRPQDGRILVDGKDKSIDVRVSSMPTPHGEKIVLRLLDKSRQPLDLTSLGLTGRNHDLFLEAIRKPHGMVLVTGPTGSGKTTTLYAALKAIYSPEINISTVEDPIEYQIAGINQTQMHAEIDYTFAAAIRTFLRQDPDVIMVGEIRDTETAKYAIQAAQTGHLVFSTLHTNDAPSAIIRLLEMEMEPYLVASTVNLIIAQRLLRRVCPQCLQQRPVDETERTYLARHGVEMQKVPMGGGCDNCAKTGYRGRIGVFEIMPVSIPISEMVSAKASTQKIRDIAIEEGMQSLVSEGIRLAREGLTTLAEVRSVMG